MKHYFLCAIFSFLTLTSALAAEDVQPVSTPSETPPVSGSVENQIAEQKKPFRFLFGGGLTFGGDTLVTMSYTDGSTDDVKAGELLMVYGGMDYRLNDDISVQGTIGYHFDSTKPASNGEVTFSRWPLELLAYYHVKDAVRLGGGFRIVNSSELEGSGIASGVNASFASTIGLVIEGEYLLSPEFGIKARYVNEKYKLANSPVSIDGSHFGILANIYF